MKVDLSKKELSYIEDLINCERDSIINYDPKNPNNIMVANLVKKLTIADVIVPKGTLCQHDRSVTNRICDDWGNTITYVPDEDLA